MVRGALLLDVRNLSTEAGKCFGMGEKCLIPELGGMSSQCRPDFLVVKKGG